MTGPRHEHQRDSPTESTHELTEQCSRIVQPLGKPLFDDHLVWCRVLSELSWYFAPWQNRLSDRSDKEALAQGMAHYPGYR